MADTPADLLLETTKTFTGHGAVVMKVFDTRGKKATVIEAKLKSGKIVLVLDASNEEDITSQFKVKRATKEFANAVMDRCNVAFREGQLRIDFDWTGIRRIQVEAALRAEKLAERKKKEEEDRIAREKHVQEEKLAEEARQKALREEEARRMREAKEAEERRIRLEQEAKEAEAKQRKKAFEDKIGNALLHGGVLTHVPKHDDEEGKQQGEIEVSEDDIVKTWSDEHKAFYYTNMKTNELTWRDPLLNSVWEKLWDIDRRQFKFLNKQTSETIWEEPYSSRIEKIWVDEESRWYYVNRVTGDTTTLEPYF